MNRIIVMAVQRPTEIGAAQQDFVDPERACGGIEAAWTVRGDGWLQPCQKNALATFKG
jgi:hypothetical protein